MLRIAYTSIPKLETEQPDKNLKSRFHHERTPSSNSNWLRSEGAATQTEQSIQAWARRDISEACACG